MDGNTNFSDVPALGDTEGLNAFLQNEQLAAQGLGSNTPAQTTTPGTTTTVDPNAAATPAAATTTDVTQTSGAQVAPAANTDQITVSKDQLAQIMASINSINQRLNTPATNTQKVTPTYSEQERNFINAALAQGYPLDKIQETIMSRRTGGVNPQVDARIAGIEKYLKQQEYKQAETTFINNLSNFGDKFGLSEQDLVTFGETALKQGINIATPGINLETVFRAVYPEQYRIRMQRMSPTNASQIYGGTSIPEGTRAAASKMEDAYVEQFLKKNMSGYMK